MTRESCDRHRWNGQDGSPIPCGAAFGIMGIVNITPDSFYDGGEYFAHDKAVIHARELAARGADILDVGAESSRPGAEPLDAATEMQRLAAPLPEIIGIGKPVSVDTWHADTAAWALKQGAGIINDISACAWDPELLDVLAQYRPGYVLMHSGDRPKHMARPREYGNVVEAVLDFFERKLDMLARAGLPEDRVALDPGIGFGKSLRQNLDLLGNIDRFLKFGRPLLVGLSMKRMFGDLLGLASGERSCATSVACALIWQKGVFWHRVHNVAATKNALELAVALAAPASTA